MTVGKEWCEHKNPIHGEFPVNAPLLASLLLRMGYFGNKSLGEIHIQFISST
jgi:hypothetical protein